MAEVFDLAEVYGPGRARRPFGFFDVEYAWPHTHRGADFRLLDPGGGDFSVSTDVVAVDGGVVVYAGKAPAFNGIPGGKVGGVVVIDTGRTGLSRYEFHAHTIPGVKVGDRVTSGQRLGRNADWNDDASWRGTSFRGAHDHMGVGEHPHACWNTAYRVLDPAPFIAAAIVRQKLQEEDMPLNDADIAKIRTIVREEAGNSVWNLHTFKAHLPEEEFGFPKETAGMRFRRLVERAGRAMLIGRENRAASSGISAAVREIAKASGLSEAVVERIVNKAVADGFAKGVGVDVTVTAGKK